MTHPPTIRITVPGETVALLQRVLGHDHLTTTQIYLNMSPEDVLAEYSAKW